MALHMLKLLLGALLLFGPQVAGVSQARTSVLVTGVSQARTSQQVTSILQVFDTRSGEVRTVREFPYRIEAPNWTVDGRYLVYNSNWAMWRISPEGGEPEMIPTGEVRCNNDHVLSADGRMLAVSGFSPGATGSRVFILPLEGGEPWLVTPNAPSYLHGWSPDGKTLCYCAQRGGNFDIYTIPASGAAPASGTVPAAVSASGTVPGVVPGGEELRLTTAEGLDDGPEYSPDGRYIWFNSVRTGLMQVWRMKADGSDQRQMTFDTDLNSWFPHVSPDGKKVVFLSYHVGDLRPDQHLADKNVCLRMMTSKGKKLHTIIELFGGQGTINVNSWSPDSRYIAFVSYRLD